MKGAIFVVLNKMIEEQHGLSVWHEILDEAGEDGIYTSTLNYDDERLYSLVAAASSKFELETADILRAFGEYLFPALHESAPMFADNQKDFFSFIDSIGRVIHIEVVKLDDKATPPSILAENVTTNSADLVYRSGRKLCFLAEGLLKGAANHYGIDINLKQQECMHHGDDHCLIRVCASG